MARLISPTSKLNVKATEEFLQKVSRDLKKPVGLKPTPQLKEAIALINERSCPMEAFYYGVFREDPDGRVTVSIPDVDVCETFGDNWDEAFENAVDALAGCLSVPETTARPRTAKHDLEAVNPGAQVMPVPVDEGIRGRY